MVRLALDYRRSFGSRRRHRHLLLPPARPQRRRRAELHAAAAVRQIERTRRCAIYIDRGSRDGRVRRGEADQIAEATTQNLQPRSRVREALDACARPSPSRTRAAGRLAEVPAVASRAVPPVNTACRARSTRRCSRSGRCRGLHAAPEGRSGVLDKRARCSPASSRSTGRPPRTSRSRRCRRAASGASRRPGQRPRHVQPAPRRAHDAEDGRAHVPPEPPRARPGAVRGRSTARSARRRARLRVRLQLDCPDALVIWEAQFGDFVQRRAGPSSTSSSPPARTSGTA
jgi:hypothetical protein